MLEGIQFANPQFFWLLLVLPLTIAWYVWKRKKQTAALRMSSVNGFKVSSSFLAKVRPLLFVLRLLALAAFITAMARPQSSDVSSKTKTTNGIDIVMAIDVSSSMLARDLKPNRLQALKRVAADFIEERPSDRIGLVVYGGESFTKTPITSDKSIALRALEDVNYGLVEDGTAIGSGLATAVNRLKDSKAKSKVIILLTDGVKTAGSIEPEDAAELAVAFGIKVYTIGIGSNGMAQTPIAQNPNGSFRYGMRKVEIDEDLLKNIADRTGGQYFRATNNASLANIYDDINKLEKTEIEEFKYTNFDEKFRPFVLLGLGLLLLEFLLRNTVFRSFI
ncbi:Ca-activated chloride channel family protein [Pustulibacterium marinum]|uniref:Ca-activated chloride channel family protein n=1 Tax=Pustulibacterium marinum TaxID=1224947 RepID=A0A1I7HHT9_9FLAO|nr:VWA domain-containing protein [Pustulibacterium marinum]SFU60268.1 Ca-activated chloride channel family protein [Pustulibacterium marinum]